MFAGRPVRRSTPAAAPTRSRRCPWPAADPLIRGGSVRSWRGAATRTAFDPGERHGGAAGSVRRGRSPRRVMHGHGRESPVPGWHHRCDRPGRSRDRHDPRQRRPDPPRIESSDADGPLNLATGAGRPVRPARRRATRPAASLGTPCRETPSPPATAPGPTIPRRSPTSGASATRKLKAATTSPERPSRHTWPPIQRRFHDPRRRHGRQRGRVDLGDLGRNGSGDRCRRATNRRAHSDQRTHRDRGHRLPQLIHPHMRAVLNFTVNQLVYPRPRPRRMP